METQRILVTGGSGFIGTNLCNELRSRGHEVLAVDLLHHEGGGLAFLYFRMKPILPFALRSAASRTLQVLKSITSASASLEVS